MTFYMRITCQNSKMFSPLAPSPCLIGDGYQINYILSILVKFTGVKSISIKINDEKVPHLDGCTFEEGRLMFWLPMGAKWVKI